MNKRCFLVLSLSIIIGLGIASAIVSIIHEPEQVVTTQLPVADSREVTAPETVIVFGGDVMLSRVVNQRTVRSGDWSWPFSRIASMTAAADIAVVNLESPFSHNGRYEVPTGSFSFNADPRSVAGLQYAGIDLVSLANNHFGNQGRQGMLDTFDILTNAGIAYTGAGTSTRAAHQPTIMERNGVRFAFLSYAYPETEAVATERIPGMANMDVSLLRSDVATARDQADVVIILMHAGTEYVTEPNWQQVEFAHAAIETGADLVIGHHPHWVQTTEIYQGKPIVYSLGNLVFDQMWSIETQQGVLARVMFASSTLERIEFIPVRIYDYGQPRIIEDELERQAILRRMGLTASIIEYEPHFSETK